MVDVAGHVAAARVAVARPGSPRRARQEHERAARVERVPQRRRRRRGRQRALPVQVVVAARVGAPEARPDAHLAAPVAPERRLRVLQPQTVLRVAEVRHLAVPHHRRPAESQLMLLPVAVALLFRVFREKQEAKVYKETMGMAVGLGGFGSRLGEEEFRGIGIYSCTCPSIFGCL